MPTQAEKALALCHKYDQLMLDIKKLSKTIGEGISACVDPKAYHWNGESPSKHNPHTHLYKAFELEVAGNEWIGPELVGKSPAEVEEILAPCIGCQMAYKAVKARKEARKQLGIVKRSIRIIGRH